VVNIHHYTPTDAEFVSRSKQKGKENKEKGKAIIEAQKSIIEPSPDQDESLDDTIFHLEEAVREKESLIRDLWKSLKLQKEELEYLKKKRNEELEKEIFHNESEA